MKPARILAVVPARGGSKRLPGKNVTLLGGKPLICWPLEVLAEARLDIACILTTDDPSIREIALDAGYWVPFLRPAELATDEATTESAVLHALDFVRSSWGADPELLMLLQPTTPFRSAADMRMALQTLDANPDAEAVLAVKKVHRTASQLYHRLETGYLSRVGQDCRPVITANGSLYLVRTPAFRRIGSFVPQKTIPIETITESSLDIDTIDDLNLAEFIYERWQRRGTCRNNG